MELDGKVGIVTGAGGGIGEGIAHLFAREGASVMVMDRNEENAKKVAADIVAQGGKAISIGADVTKADEIKATVDATVKAFGTLDILVNNAGISVNPSPPVHEMSEEQWERMLGVNLKGTFLCTKAALQIMVPKKKGKVVNIASVAGIRQAVFGGVDYTSSKHGMLGFTQHLAWELGPYGINVNAVCPGGVVTGIGNAEAKVIMKKVDQILVPFQRSSTTEEIAHAVVFLSSERSNMITGHALPVDGGMLQGWGEEIRQMMTSRPRNEPSLGH